jgi:hypothetical protein
MKYCYLTTTTHPIAIKYSTCVEDLNAIITNEGYSGTIPVFTNSEVAINMDCVEALFSIEINRIERNKSMDIAFGLTNNDSTKKQMLLVEFKFNMHDFYGLRRESLIEKVQGSLAILGDTPPVYKRYIIVVQTKYLQEAISRIYRMVPKIDSTYVVLDLTLLHSTYF